MNRRRVVALFRRVVEEMRRDRRSLVLLFVAPVAITGLVTFILREGQAPTVHLAIVNEAGPVGQAIVSNVTVTLVGEGSTVIPMADEAAARAAIEDGDASLAIILPAGLGPATSATPTAAPPSIIVLTSGLDPAGEGAQVAAVVKALGSAVQSAVGATAGGGPPTIVHSTVYGSPSTDPVAPYAPAIVGFFAYFFVYILTGVSFLRERTGGTLERLLATPVTRAEIVVGYTLGYGLFAALQVALLLVWALSSLRVSALGPLPAFSIGLGVPMAGSPLLAYLVVVLLAVGAVSLGIFLSTFARTELQVIQFIPLVLVPQFLLSGVLFPVATLPAVLQPIVPLMPLQYAVNGLREVFVRGADLGVGAVQLDLVVLAVIAVLFAVIASLTIRREVA